MRQRLFSAPFQHSLDFDAGHEDGWFSEHNSWLSGNGDISKLAGVAPCTGSSIPSAVANKVTMPWFV